MNPNCDKDSAQLHRELLAKLRQRATDEVDSPEITAKLAIQLYFDAFKIDQAERKLSGEAEAREAARRAEKELNEEWFELAEIRR
jgi:hypothetical protein